MKKVISVVDLPMEAARHVQNRNFSKNSEIATYLRARTGQVHIKNTPVGTGFFISSKAFLTCHHTITSQWNIEATTAELIIEEQRFGGRLKHIHRDFDLAFYEIDNTTDQYIDLPYSVPIQGDSILLGGYPLTQTSFTFHSGMLSSEENTGLLTIDATVVPGNSGSPVIFLNDDKEAFLAGIVVAEVANLQREFRQMDANLNRLQHRYGGSISAYNDTTGQAVRATGVINDLRSLYDTMRQNFSTGIGRILPFNQVVIQCIINKTTPESFHATTLEDLSIDRFAKEKKKREIAKLINKAAARSDSRMETFDRTRYEVKTTRELASHFDNLGQCIFDNSNIRHTHTNKTEFVNPNTGWYICYDKQNKYNTVFNNDGHYVALDGTTSKSGKDNCFHFRNTE